MILSQGTDFSWEVNDLNTFTTRVEIGVGDVGFGDGNGGGDRQTPRGHRGSSRPTRDARDGQRARDRGPGFRAVPEAFCQTR